MFEETKSGNDAKAAEWSREQVAEAAIRLKEADPDSILKWAVGEFGSEMALACSFGYEDVSLVYRLSRIDPEQTVPIFYLDTDLLFPETYETRDRLAGSCGVSFIRVTPAYTLERQAQLWGDELWKREPHSCCLVRKVEPLRRFLKGRTAWITGIRREQAPSRGKAEVVEWDHQFGLVKINPLAYRTSDEVWRYIQERNIPHNPLHDRMYPSIGCIPCTRPVRPGEDIRAGRWSGFGKTECGLHPSKQEEED
ncbi:phosphoadenylyl-sulfate reductase [Salinithrix halophila]|uniref:Adenosine 5'-phosphosulfate reductase n=1 Tax=Salinithrix halophila TaxID=1485204 RepID=A0ABV8JDS2_9BACL